MAYWALSTAFCAVCCVLLPDVEVMPFNSEFPNKPLAPIVPGKLNSGEVSVLEELDDVPDISVSMVWVMAYSTWSNAFWAACAGVVFEVFDVVCCREFSKPAALYVKGEDELLPNEVSVSVTASCAAASCTDGALVGSVAGAV